MKIKCINLQQIIDYHDGQMKQQARRDITIHLGQCDICSKNLVRLRKIDRHLSFENQKKIVVESKKMIDRKCINDIELYDYLEGRLTNDEARAVEVHLNLCYTCFESFASLLRNSLTEASPEEFNEISEMRNITIEEQVDKIVAIIGTECPEKSRRIPKVAIDISEWWEKIKSIFENSFLVKKRWRWATAFACVLLVIGFIGYPQYRNWQSNVLSGKAIQQLTQEIFITEEEALLPSGGFKFSIFGSTRGDEDIDAIQTIKKTLEHALKVDPDNSLSHQYLGTYYLLVASDTSQARYHYRFSYQRDTTNASILNDLGVLAIACNNYNEAINFFKRALIYAPRQFESQYNLILAYGMQGKFAMANQELENYKENLASSKVLDPHLSWFEIARKQIENLKMK